ncbi:ABC transporter permease subunit [Streptomonospora salina]|uniref:Maltose/maltodextrin transport system permease protein n=1 Tax=Streptomonospora salina TaxID=104205 RepID=A0A841E9I7_9ACTN|nr:ABC transporter permease subunit [Streptomonospora salina]MBB5997170.1 arabinogalactan oligomer/maltooligosaccharide transport system permease protein [Streptomonospora salina]
MASDRPDTAGAPGGAPARPRLPGGSLAPRGSATGQLAKIAVLGLTAAIALWAVFPLYAARQWTGVAAVAAVTALIFYVYLSKRAVPAKYLVPGTLFLIAFQIIPVLYTISTSMTNYSDGHRGTKEQAIDQIEASSVERTPDSTPYTLTVAARGSSSEGELVFLLTDPGGDAYAGDADGLQPLSGATADPSGKITDAPGYTVLPPGEANARSAEITGFAVPTGSGTGIRSSGLSSAFEGRSRLAYDADCDCITDTGDGRVYTADDDRGAFVTDGGERLPQGWQVNVGLANFARFVSDSDTRSSFLSILTWNVAFAAGTTAMVFVLGLGVALTLHTREPLAGRTAYRLLVVLPYAMPSFAMFLLWKSMFNADFGLVNRLLGLDVDWFGHPWSARAAVLIVNIWLGFPYMFLVATGALQSIPRELVQAARIDGAGAWQALRRVTLPLLMVSMAPILVATFAFNFNNFNAVWLTTEGGPFPTDSPLAGATDLLITYTYRLAFGVSGAQYGYAAALSVFIFLIVTVMSVVSLRRSASLEEVHR